MAAPLASDNSSLWSKRIQKSERTLKVCVNSRITFSAATWKLLLDVVPKSKVAKSQFFKSNVHLKGKNSSLILVYIFSRLPNCIAEIQTKSYIIHAEWNHWHFSTLSKIWPCVGSRQMSGYHFLQKLPPPPIQTHEQPDQCSGKVVQIQPHEIPFDPDDCFGISSWKLRIRIVFPHVVSVSKARDLTRMFVFPPMVANVGHRCWWRDVALQQGWRDDQPEERQEVTVSPSHPRLTVNQHTCSYFYTAHCI